MAEARLPLAGESSGQARWSRAAAVVDRYPFVLVGGVWAAWLIAVLGVVVGGVKSGAIEDPLGKWVHVGGSLWPLFTWDYTWYHNVAIAGYPADQGGPQYAFFPLWPLLLRATGSIPDWVGALAVTIVASGFAFAGVAAANPSVRAWRTAVVLACWPGSFLLLLAYPDVIALAAAAWAAAFALGRHPWLAGVAAAVAAVARPTGLLIAIPLALVARGSLAGRVFAPLAPVAGAAAVHAYFWAHSGDSHAFLHAESLPLWERNGPNRLYKWPRHVVDAIIDHRLAVVAITLVAAAVIVFLALRLGVWYAAGAAYLYVVVVLLLGAQTSQTRIQSAILALVVVVLALLWRLGPRYWPWFAFAVAVVAVSIFSGSVTSFSRQALFAFPLYWAVADGPRRVRHPLIVVAAIAANVAYALTLAKYAP